MQVAMWMRMQAALYDKIPGPLQVTAKNVSQSVILIGNPVSRCSDSELRSYTDCEEKVN